MTAPRFFLSHSSRDKLLVLPVDRVLKALGLTVWTDRFEIRAGDSLIRRIFDQGLDTSDYVCAFITKNSEQSPWVREELEFALAKSISEGRPKIIMLQFDGASIPPALRSRRYASLERHELGEIVREITASADLMPMDPQHAPTPYAANDFHDALRDGDVTFLLASRQDDLDFDPIVDPEGIIFKRRHLYVLRLDLASGEIRYHYLAKVRPTHTTMRVVDDRLLVFINTKAEPNTFEMEGWLYQLRPDTLRAVKVDTVFFGHNWGFDPVIDEQGRIHHKDFETDGNPVHIDDGKPDTIDHHELSRQKQAWRSAICPFETAYGPGRETGYLRFLAVDPSLFDEFVAGERKT
jgi:hypothetical protein